MLNGTWAKIYDSQKICLKVTFKRKNQAQSPWKLLIFFCISTKFLFTGKLFFMEPYSSLNARWVILEIKNKKQWKTLALWHKSFSFALLKKVIHTVEGLIVQLFRLLPINYFIKYVYLRCLIVSLHKRSLNEYLPM